MSPTTTSPDNRSAAVNLALGEHSNADAQLERTTLLDMHLAIGDALQLDCGAPLKSKKAYVKLLGYLKDRSIIVTAPTLGGLRVDLVESDIVLVRGFSGVNAYAFRAIVTRVCRLPFDYIHLSFPDAVFGRSVRQSPRVRTDLEARIISGTPEQTASVTAKVVDLSGLGALISSSEVFDPAHPLRLGVPLTLHGNRVEVEVEGSIVSHRTDASSGTPVQSYGLKFTRTDPHDAMLLNAYVYQQIVDHPHSVR